MNKRVLSLPEPYSDRLEAALQAFGYSLKEPRKIAGAIQRLSDHYSMNPLAATPWNEDWVQAASLAYYFPLNYARNRAVAIEAHRLGFFSGLKTVADFGSGMGSALHAFRDEAEGKNAATGLSYQAHDVSAASLELGRGLGPPDRPAYSTHSAAPHFALSLPRPKEIADPSKLLLLASYVLTELEETPKWWLESEALVIIEPSTQDDGRKLMTLRQRLIDEDYKIWAPCTHQDACPLLTQSAKDWCHDRIHWNAPAWFLEIEKYLPMKNRTLTFSYLLARKTLEPPVLLKDFARLTGDTLVEKGKSRQSVCRSPEREFLAWFPQRLEKDQSIELERGLLVRLKADLQKKSSEVRLSSPDDIVAIAPDFQLD